LKHGFWNNFCIPVTRTDWRIVLSENRLLDQGGKLLLLQRRHPDQTEEDARIVRRNQVVTNLIVGILSDLLLSWKRPAPGGVTG
jgi:hypothetical protein